MNKKEYLVQLTKYLQGFPEEELKDIICDYKEHFDIGISKGKSEEDIAKELGNPKDIANNFKTESNNIEKKETLSNDRGRKIIVFIFLFLFNLIIVLGPYLGLVGLLLALYGVGMSFVFAGISLLFGFPIAYFSTFKILHITTSLSFGIGFIALGVLGLLLSIFLSKKFIKLSVDYVKWNFRLINGGVA